MLSSSLNGVVITVMMPLYCGILISFAPRSGGCGSRVHFRYSILPPDGTAPTAALPVRSFRLGTMVRGRIGRQRRPAENDVGKLLGHHDDGRVQIAAHDLRQDGC